MILETHAHTAEHSRCSRSAAADVVRQALARNLQGLVLTDHHYRWERGELEQLRRAAGVPRHFVLLSGQEVSTSDHGHVLVFGRVPSLAEGTSSLEIRERFPEAALVLAHPSRHRLDHRLEQLAPPTVDAVEIFSANHTIRGNARALEDWHRYRFTALAGTDAHGQVPAGTFPSQFDHPVEDEEELAHEIRRGRCRPFFKEITLAGANTQVTEVVIGTKGESEQRPRIVLRRMARRADWERAAKTAAASARIAALGFPSARYRLPAVLDVDARRMTIIEEGLRARTLFEKMRTAGPAEGRACLELAAGWLARLHALELAHRPRVPFARRERQALAGYAARFRGVAHPQAALACTLAGAIEREEHRMLRAGTAALVQCHGDFHPKNVLVGQDNREDQESLFVAAVDLEGALVAPRALDVGAFLAHYEHQFATHPRVLAAFPGSLFLAAYRRECPEAGAGFEREVEFFTARARLGIAAYLVKLGLGGSETLSRLLAECRRALLEDTGAAAAPAPPGER